MVSNPAAGEGVRRDKRGSEWSKAGTGAGCTAVLRHFASLRDSWDTIGGNGEKSMFGRTFVMRRFGLFGGSRDFGFELAQSAEILPVSSFLSKQEDGDPFGICSRRAPERR
jgi:hypothetical protein